MQRIAYAKDINRALDRLCIADPRLVAVRVRAGEVPLRLDEPGFASLLSIIISQQISRASADAIRRRFNRLVDPLTPQAVLEAGEAVFREAGLSRPKQRAVLGLAQAVGSGLDLEGLCLIEPEAAIAELSAVPGIGRWTAEVYLLFCAGHPDIFPARDVALQAAVGQALGIEPRPDEKELRGIAESWIPFRGVAARLFWAYYRTMRGREGAPASSPGPDAGDL